MEDYFWVSDNLERLVFNCQVLPLYLIRLCETYYIDLVTKMVERQAEFVVEIVPETDITCCVL